MKSKLNMNGIYTFQLTRTGWRHALHYEYDLLCDFVLFTEMLNVAKQIAITSFLILFLCCSNDA